MRARRMTALAVLILCCSCLLAQEEPGYFSLSTNRTYAPGQKATIDVWAQRVDTLEFRVYRVNDPVKFFLDLGDIHQFGGRVPPPPHKLTAIERFHNWKHDIFISIRDFFRAQFTAENRHTIREQRSAGKQQKQSPAQTFAQIPLINSQQLVATFKQPMTGGRARWESETVDVPVKDKGVYLVEATDGKLRAYTIVIVSQMAMITKTAPGTVLAFVADRNSGVPVASSQTYFFIDRTAIGQPQSTSAQGIAQVTVNQAQTDNVLVMSRTKDDFTVSSPWSYWMSNDPARNLSAYVYTDRPVYRPGDTVHFKAILRTRSGAVYQVPANTDYNVYIADQEGKEVFNTSLKSSAMGTLKGEWTAPSNATLGDYYVNLRFGDRTETGGTFAVEEYKKPEYEVRVTPDAKRVLQGQAVKATIEAKYYFGEPVAGAKVTWVVHESKAWNGLYTEEEQDEYGGYGGEEGSSEGSDDYYAGEQTEEKTGTLDENGRLQITLPTKFDAKQKYDVNYRIEARVTDQGNREISGHNYVLATYGSFQIGASPNSYLYNVGDNAQLNVEARDYDNKPVQTPFHVELSTWDYGSRKSNTVLTTDGQTDANGKAQVTIPIKNGGSLHAVVTAKTPENREIEARAYIWVPDRNWSWGGAREQIQIFPDQKSYKPGDTAKVVIMAGNDPVSVLVTTEGNGLMSQQVARSKGGPITVQFPITLQNAPNFYVSAAFLKDNTLHQGSKNINVPPDAFKLNVDIQPSKPQFQPGESASYTVVAKDAQGKPAIAEFSLGVVDEAIYAIKPDNTTDIL